MTIGDSGNPHAELVQRLLDQDRERLIALAERILRDRHEAEDVVQDTVTSVWQRLPVISVDKVPNYLNRAVRQNALKRKARSRSFAALDGSEVPTAGRAGDVDPIDLEEAIASLPLAQQNVIRMKYYFGMTFHQIGIALSISTHTAGSRCRYALAKLRHFFTR